MIPFIKAQINQVFKWGIIAIIVAVLPMIAFTVVNKIMTLSCQTALLDFESKLKDISEIISATEFHDEKLDSPCKVDTVYIVDENVATSEFDDYPVIKEKLLNVKNMGENVFLLENKKLMHSFYMGKTKISAPDYICADTRHGSIQLLFEGVGELVNVRHKDNRLNCGPIEVEPAKPDKIKTVFASLQSNQQIRNKIGSETEIANQQQNVIGNAEISRSVKCESDKEAKIKITLKAKQGKKLKEVTYMESIDKSCLKKLKASPEEIKRYIGGVDEVNLDVSVISDPLIVWSFNPSFKISDEEVKLSYTIDECCGHEFINGILMSKKAFDLAISDEANKIKGRMPASSDLLELINKDIEKGDFASAKRKKAELDALAKNEDDKKAIEEFGEQIEIIEEKADKGKARTP